MAKLLYVKANPKPEERSYSLSVGREFIRSYAAKNPADIIDELDLYGEDVPFINADYLSGLDKLSGGQDFEDLSGAEKAAMSAVYAWTDRFMEADKYVFAFPMWNFSVPPHLKAFVDTICIARKTFAYQATGPVGLLKNKKAVLIQASGGFYSQGEGASLNYCSRFLEQVMKLIGVSVEGVVFCEGMAYQPENADKFKAQAIAKAVELAENF